MKSKNENDEAVFKKVNRKSISGGGDPNGDNNNNGIDFKEKAFLAN